MKPFLRILCVAAALAVLSSAALAGESKVQVGGTFYFDYFVDTSDGADEGDDPVKGFQLRRAYLTVRKSFGDTAFRHTSDMAYSSETGNLNLYTKYAYLQRKCIIPGSKMLLGLHSPQTHGWVEKRWGHRSMAKTLSDERKWTHSAQLGLGIQGKAAGGRVEYYVDFNNGNGYKKALAKDGVGFSGRLATQPLPGLWLSGMFSRDTPGGDSDEADTYVEGLAGYDMGIFALFAQYGLFTDGNNDDLEESGLSLFGRATLKEGLKLVGRFDRIDPDTDDDGHNWILVGLDLQISEGIWFQPSYRMTRHQAEGADGESEIVATFYGKL